MMQMMMVQIYKNKMSIKTIFTAILFLVFFFFGLFTNKLFFNKKISKCDNNFIFINTSILCGKEDVVIKTGYIETQKKVESFLESMKKEGKIVNSSVYFRDLVHGPVFGINELASFAPASLLKLPLSFAFLISSEKQPELLDKKVDYIGEEQTFSQRVAPKESAKPSTPYRIEELLRMMISYSDNSSYEALEAFISNTPERTQIRLEVMQELGIIDPKDRIEKTVTTRGYSSLFRILYNISYLSPENSEKLLSWLSQSDYDKGIKAGIPENIVLAHKFGERGVDEFTNQLHDCGIVYYPENPYLLCVMTTGKNFADLEYVISHISKMVYEEFDSRKIRK